MSKRGVGRFQTQAERDAVSRVAVWRTDRFVKHLAVAGKVREIASEGAYGHRFSVYRYGEYKEALTNRCLPGLASKADKSLEKSAAEKGEEDTSEEEAEERLIVHDAVVATKHLDKTPDPTLSEQLFTEPKQAHALRADSLYLFDAHATFRIFLYNIIKHRVFENFILLVILFNSAMLATEPQMVEDLGQHTFDSMDYFVTAVYTAEMLLKILALGFVMHKGSYLQDPWNGLDFFVVVTTYISMIGGDSASAGSSFTALRTFRVVRPLRSMNAIKGLKILVRSLSGSVTKLTPVLVMLFLSLFVFAILSVQLFGGAFMTYCVNVTSDEITSLPCRRDVQGVTYWGAGCDGFLGEGFECRTVGNQDPTLYNFDNVLTGMLVLFTITTFDGWTGILNTMFASIGVISFLYFVLVSLIIGFIVPNLVLAVINLEYARAQERDREYDVKHYARVRRLVQQRTNQFLVTEQAQLMRGKARAERDERQLLGLVDDDEDDVASAPGSPSSFLLDDRRHQQQQHGSAASFGDGAAVGGNKSDGDGGSDISAPRSAPQAVVAATNNNNNTKNNNSKTSSSRARRARITTPEGHRSPRAVDLAAAAVSPPPAAAAFSPAEHHSSNDLEIRYVEEEEVEMMAEGDDDEVAPDPTAAIILKPNYAEKQPEQQPAWITFDEAQEEHEAGPSIAALRNIAGNRDAPVMLGGGGGYSAAAGVNPLLAPSQQQRQLMAAQAMANPQHTGQQRQLLLQQQQQSGGGGGGGGHSRTTSTGGVSKHTGHTDDSGGSGHHHHQHQHGVGGPSLASLSLGTNKRVKKVPDENSWDYRFKMLRKRWNQMRDWCHEFTEGYERSVAGRLALVSGRESDFSEVSSTDTELQQFKQSSKGEETSSSVQNLAAAEAGVEQSQSHFAQFIVTCILLNTATLASQHYNQPLWLEQLQDITNLIFTIIFTIELVFRLMALGFEKYTRSAFNNLDGIIVIASLIELALAGASVVSVFRALRLLRVLKLLKQFPTIRALVRVAFAAMADTLYLLLIILLYLFIFALLGNSLFKDAVDDTDEIRTTFKTFGDSFYTAFQLLSQDLWVPLMYHTMEQTNAAAALFFIVQIFFGSFVLLAMFLSILVETFNRMDQRRMLELEEDPDEGGGINANMFKQNMLDSQVVRKVYSSGRDEDEVEAAAAGGGGGGHDHGSAGNRNNKVFAKLPEQLRRDLERAQQFEQEEEARMLSDLKRRQSRLGSLRLNAAAVLGVQGTNPLEDPTSPRMDNVQLSPRNYNLNNSNNHTDEAANNGTDYGSAAAGGAGDGFGGGDADGGVSNSAPLQSIEEDGTVVFIASDDSLESPPEGATVTNSKLNATNLREQPVISYQQQLYHFLTSPDGGGNRHSTSPNGGNRPAKCKKGTFGDLSLESVPPDSMLPREFREARLKRKQSQNIFFAPPPRRIKDIVPAIILFHEGPAPPDPPPKERNVTCHRCGEVYAQPLPAAPMMAPPDPELFHDLQCARIRLRKSKEHILRALLDVVTFYIANDEERAPEKVENILQCAWDVKCMRSVTTEDVLETDSPWHTLENEIKEALDVLDLRTGEEELGKSLVAYAFACIPIEHQTNGGESLFVFGPENPFRLALSKLVWNPYFGYFILFSIIASSILIAMQNPRDTPGSETAETVGWLSLFFTIVFTFEAAAKIVAFGFVLHEGAYLRDLWNWLDFIVVIVSLITDTRASLNFRILRIIRTFRALRPLRILNRNSNLKTTAYAMAENLKAIANVALLMLIALFIFSILAVQLFAGKFHSCSDPSITTKAQCTGEWYDPNAANRDINAWDGMPFGATVNRTWRTETRNFDNVGNSLLTLFQVSTSEAWLQILWRAFDACSTEAVEKNCSKAQALFFIAFFAIAGFFLTQLFVSFIIHNYDMVQESINGSNSMTEEQKVWVQTQQLLVNLRPYIAMVPDEDDLAQWLHTHIVSRPWFDPLLATCILTDILSIALFHYDMSQAFKDVIQAFNILFQIVFVLEAALKIATFRLRYFKNGANQFDFFLVIIGFIGLAASDVQSLIVLRVFRFLRIMRLLRGAQGIQILMETIVYSLPSIANMGAFIILITFCFGVLGVDLFAKLYIPPSAEVLDNRYNNFRQLDYALMLLYRFLTLEDWVGALSDAQVQEPTCTTEENCGSSVFALYFCGFVIINTYIILNLVMAIILVNFELTMKLTGTSVRLGSFHKFVDIWSEYDQATMILDTKLLPLLLYRLGPPLGLSRKESRNQVMRKLKQYFIPVHGKLGGQVHFIEVLLALAQGSSRTDLSARDQREFSERLRGSFEELNALNVFRHNNRTLTTDLYFAQTYMAAAHRRNVVVEKKVDRWRLDRREEMRQFCERKKIPVPEPRIVMRLPLVLGARRPTTLSTSDGNAINIPAESALGHELWRVAYKTPRDIAREQAQMEVHGLAGSGSVGSGGGSAAAAGFMSNLIQSNMNAQAGAAGGGGGGGDGDGAGIAGFNAAGRRSFSKPSRGENDDDDYNNQEHQQQQPLRHQPESQQQQPSGHHHHHEEQESAIASAFAAQYLEKQRRQNKRAAAAAAAASSSADHPELRVETPAGSPIHPLSGAAAADGSRTPSSFKRGGGGKARGGGKRSKSGGSSRSTTTQQPDLPALAVDDGEPQQQQSSASPPASPSKKPGGKKRRGTSNKATTPTTTTTTSEQEQQQSQHQAPSLAAAPVQRQSTGVFSPAAGHNDNDDDDDHRKVNAGVEAAKQLAAACQQQPHQQQQQHHVRFESPSRTATSPAGAAAAGAVLSPHSSQRQQQQRPQSASASTLSRTTVGSPSASQRAQQPQQNDGGQQQQQEPRPSSAGPSRTSSTSTRRAPAPQAVREVNTPGTAASPPPQQPQAQQQQQQQQQEPAEGDDEQNQDKDEEPASVKPQQAKSPPPARPASPSAADQQQQEELPEEAEEYEEEETDDFFDYEEEEEEEEEESSSDDAASQSSRQQQLSKADYDSRARFLNIFEIDDREELLRKKISDDEEPVRFSKILRQHRREHRDIKFLLGAREINASCQRIVDDITLQERMERGNISSSFRTQLRLFQIDHGLRQTEAAVDRLFDLSGGGEFSDFVAEYDAIVRRCVYEKVLIEQRIEREQLAEVALESRHPDVAEPEQLERVRVVSAQQQQFRILCAKEKCLEHAFEEPLDKIYQDEEESRAALAVFEKSDASRVRREVVARELGDIEAASRSAVADDEEPGARQTMSEHFQREFLPLLDALYRQRLDKLERDADAAVERLHDEDDSDRMLVAAQFRKQTKHAASLQHRRERAELEDRETKTRKESVRVDEVRERGNIGNRALADRRLIQERLDAEKRALAIAEANAVFDRERYIVEEKSKTSRPPLVAEEEKMRRAIVLQRRLGAANIQEREMVAARRQLEEAEAEMRASFVTGEADEADSKIVVAGFALARMNRDFSRQRELIAESEQVLRSHIVQAQGELHVELAQRSQQLHEQVLFEFFESVRRRTEVKLSALQKLETAERSNLVNKEAVERELRWTCPVCDAHPPYRLSRLAADVNESPHGMGSRKLKIHVYHHQLEITKLRMQRDAFATEEFCSRGSVEALSFSQFLLDVYGALSELTLAAAADKNREVSTSDAVNSSLRKIREREQAEWASHCDVSLFAEQRDRVELEAMAVRGSIELRALHAPMIYVTTDTAERAPLVATMGTAFPLQDVFASRRKQQKPLEECRRVPAAAVEELLPRKRVTMSIIARNSDSDDEECYEPVTEFGGGGSGAEFDEDGNVMLNRVGMLERTVDVIVRGASSPSPQQPGAGARGAVGAYGAGGGGSPFLRAGSPHHLQQQSSSPRSQSRHEQIMRRKQEAQEHSAARQRGAQLLDELHQQDDDEDDGELGVIERQRQEMEEREFEQQMLFEQQQQQQSADARATSSSASSAALSKKQKQLHSRLARLGEYEEQYRGEIATVESRRRARLLASFEKGSVIVGLSPEAEQQLVRIVQLEALRRQGLAEAEVSDRTAMYVSRRGSRLQRRPQISPAGYSSPAHHDDDEDQPYRVSMLSSDDEELALFKAAREREQRQQQQQQQQQRRASSTSPSGSRHQHHHHHSRRSSGRVGVREYEGFPLDPQLFTALKNELQTRDMIALVEERREMLSKKKKQLETLLHHQQQHKA